MKSYKLLLAALAFGSALMTTGCRDDFSEINQDPSAVTTGNVSFLFAEAVNRFDPQAYLEYFYNAPMKYSWSGMGISTGGASEGILTLSIDGDQSRQYLNVLRVLRAMDKEMESLDEDMRAQNQGYVAAAHVLSIYLGIYATDMYGSIPYVEACQAAYGGTLTPNFDSVESLYDLWLNELNTAIASFTSGEVVMKSEEDVVYGGNTAKWAKFANSLKLRIAVRLLAQNESKAKQIAADVASASCGYIDALDEDVRFNKGKVRLTGNEGYVNDCIYHWSNGFTGCAGRETVINFMVENRDPRVRFFYKKNSWNSKIVQGYYDAGLEIPEFIEKNVVSEVGADGKKKFVKWGGPGEPWVRYYGMTEAWMASNDNTGKYKWFFPSSYTNADKELYLHNSEGNNPTSYTVYSTLNQMMIIGRYYNAADQVSGATLPDDTYTFTTTDRPWYGMYMTTAEVNLYLAEFKLLGANLPGSAQDYFNKALRASVEEYDRLARSNKIPYYGTTYNYDPNEKPIDLVAGEIDEMMSYKDYQLTGNKASDLEKVYIQQILHFLMSPIDAYSTARRSGVPKIGSSIFPRMDYSANGYPVTNIPRRVALNAPNPTDLMYDNLIEAYKEQGLSVGSGDILNSERIWQDTNAPQWGAGPIL